MRVFNVNKAIGAASSGVEYAQRYRREVFAGIAGIEDYYVFTDYLPTNPAVFTDRLGFARSQVLWVYHLLSGRQTRASAVTLDDFLATIDQPHAAPQCRPDHTEVALADSPVRYRIKTLAGPVLDRVETVVGDRIVRVEHYDEALDNVEHFHDGRLARRVFHTADGRVAAEQLYRDRQIVRTIVKPASPLYDGSGSFRGDLVLEGRSRFFQFVFGRLLDRPDDVVIVDRALDVVDGLYPVVGERRLYSVVHAEHYDLQRVDDGVLLWNNHYENIFTRPDLVDGLVVATQRQKEVLERQLASRDADIPVAAIPAGVVTTPAAAQRHEPYALVTASRLADEKHIDILIRAVARARTTLPALRLDVYGEGNRDGLLAVVEETHTQDCVRLMGHRQLDGLLGGYGLYVSASTSEGFGLSLLEAMAQGLPIVGFDVDYGNREMVEPGVNGLLVPHADSDRDVEAMAAAFVEVLTSGALDEMRRQSLRKAEAYTAPTVRRLWERLLC